MNAKKYITHLVCFTSVAYTVLSLAVVISGLSLPESTYATIGEPIRFLHLLLFSFVLAVGSTVKKIGSITSIVSEIINALCVIGGSFAFLLLGGTEFYIASVASIAIAAIYFTVVLIKVVVKKRKPSSNSGKAPKKSNKKQEYTKQF